MSEPQIRYARTVDGVSIAYAVMGEGIPLVYSSNVMGDLHWYTNNPGTRQQIDRLVAAGCQVVRYDIRGMGSSDRDVVDFSIHARVLDLAAVVDAIGVDRFTLCGYAHGSAIAITYAAAHPDRVSHLVLVNPYASGAAYYEKVPPAGAMIELRSVAERDWDFYTLTLASAMAAHDDPEAAKLTAALFRSAVSPATYFAFAEQARATMVTALLDRLEVPTLVLIDPSPSTHPDLAKAVAAPIRGARLATTNDYIRELLLFMGFEVSASQDVASAPSRAASGTAIILFVDIADSTSLTELLGDAAFRTAERELDKNLRTAMRDAGGAPVEGKVLGDGVMGVFASAAQAIDAACRCIEFSAKSELRLHVGLHAGDVIREEDNVYGGAVNIASRICGLSAPGEIVVSATVRELARTSAGVTFEERGEHNLKGVADPVRTYTVRPGE